MRTKNKSLIFIVEDDINYQEYIKNELEFSNANEIEIYSNGIDCINNLFKMPDIILLDYHLEGEMNGLEVLKQIKAFNPDIQVILLSAQEKLEIAVNSLKYGAYDYITKNEVAMKKINDMVLKILNLNKLLKENKKYKRIKSIVSFGIFSTILFLIITTFL